MKKLYKILDWDSKHFGYKVARVDADNIGLTQLNKLIKELSGNDVRLVYCFADSMDTTSNKTAKVCDGFLADEKVTYIRNVAEKIKPVNDTNVTSYLGKPLNSRLRYLALEAGIYSRYRIDPNFKNGEFEKLYSEWIKKSLSAEIAKDVLVYRIKNKEMGFVSLEDKDGRCNIGLIATDPQYRNKGVGTKLVEASLRRAAAWKYKEIEVVTQKSNIIAGKFYEALGFEIKSIVNIYHFWL